jgi:hypothetical protein
MPLTNEEKQILRIPDNKVAKKIQSNKPTSGGSRRKKSKKTRKSKRNKTRR